MSVQKVMEESMNNNDMGRPKQKAVRSQQTILGWLLLWSLIGLGLQYSSYLLYRDMGGFHIGSVFLSLTGLIILVISLVRYPKELKISRDLDRTGSSTAGKVTETWVKKHRGKRQSKSYFVAYKFGDGYGAVQRVSRTNHKKLKVEDVVMIRHLTGDPNRSRLEIERL